MAVPLFAPTRESDLLAWSRNFNTLIAADPAAYGLDAAQAVAYGVLHDAFAAAYGTASNPRTNSKANVNAKNVARLNLLGNANGARALVRIVQAFPGMTDDVRGQLGLRIADTEPSAIAAPGDGPELMVVATVGRVVKVRLRDRASVERRGKPIGAIGATVLYYVGEQPPASLSQWGFALNASRTIVDVIAPPEVEAGAKMWLTAFWFNARMDASPAAKAKSVRIGDGLAMAA